MATMTVELFDRKAQNAIEGRGWPQVVRTIRYDRLLKEGKSIGR